MARFFDIQEYHDQVVLQSKQKIQEEMAAAQVRPQAAATHPLLKARKNLIDILNDEIETLAATIIQIKLERDCQRKQHMVVAAAERSSYIADILHIATVGNDEIHTYIKQLASFWDRYATKHI